MNRILTRQKAQPSDILTAEPFQPLLLKLFKYSFFSKTHELIAKKISVYATSKVSTFKMFVIGIPAPINSLYQRVRGKQHRRDGGKSNRSCKNSDIAKYRQHD